MNTDKKIETKEEFEARIQAENALRIKTRIKAGAVRRRAAVRGY